MFVGVRRIVGALGLAALLATGAACSGSGSTPRTLPPVSFSPTASPSSTPASRQAELDAATAVVREYFQLLNQRTSIEQAAGLESITLAACPCRRVARSIRQILSRGQHYFGHNRVVSVTPTVDSPTSVDALVQYNFSRGGIRDVHGRLVTSTSGRTGTLLSFQLEQHENRWLITRIVTVRQGRSA